MLVNKPISKIQYVSIYPESRRSTILDILSDYSDNEEYYIEDFNATLKSLDLDNYYQTNTDKVIC